MAVPFPVLEDGIDVADGTAGIRRRLPDGRERPFLPVVVDKGRERIELDLPRHGVDVVGKETDDLGQILLARARADNYYRIVYCLTVFRCGHFLP